MTPHGTYSRYTHHGCRCEPCTIANRNYHACQRERLASRPRSDVPHGTAGGYANWCCRCQECKAAHRVNMVAAYARRKAAKATVPAEDSAPSAAWRPGRNGPPAVTADATSRPGGGAHHATVRSAPDLPRS